MIILLAMLAAFLGVYLGILYLLYHYGWRGLRLCVLSMTLLISLPYIVVIGTKILGKKHCNEKQVHGRKKIAAYMSVFKSCVIVLPISLNDALNEISPNVKKRKARKKATIGDVVRALGASVSAAAEEYAMVT